MKKKVLILLAVLWILSACQQESQTHFTTLVDLIEVHRLELEAAYSEPVAVQSTETWEMGPGYTIDKVTYRTIHGTEEAAYFIYYDGDPAGWKEL